MIDLKERLNRTRWTDEITGANWEYGIPMNFMKELHRYWLNEYDWRKTESYINSYDNFIARIDNYDIHFLYIKGTGQKTIPLIITHGWPGSFLEIMPLIPLLTQNADLSFDVVIPSMPGYGFSERVIRPGCNSGFIADLWVKLMKSLGYEKFALQGGDFGASVSSAVAIKYPEKVIGLHLNYIPGNYSPQLAEGEEFTDEEKEYFKSEDDWYFREGGYSLQQRTKPITLAYGLNDSPMGLCAWIAEKMCCWADHKGHPENIFTKEQILSNVSLYWFTETIHSSIRLYGENRKYPFKTDKNNLISVPVGIAKFRYEEPFPPRRFIERGFNIQHWSEFAEGGHYPAEEKPGLFAKDIKDFFSGLI